jgi:hypothetical protein
MPATRATAATNTRSRLGCAPYEQDDRNHAGGDERRGQQHLVQEVVAEQPLDGSRCELSQHVSRIEVVPERQPTVGRYLTRWRDATDVVV